MSILGLLDGKWKNGKWTQWTIRTIRNLYLHLKLNQQILHIFEHFFVVCKNKTIFYTFDFFKPPIIYTLHSIIIFLVTMQNMVLSNHWLITMCLERMTSDSSTLVDLHIFLIIDQPQFIIIFRVFHYFIYISTSKWFTNEFIVSAFPKTTAKLRF